MKYISAIIILIVVGYFGYDYYMTKMPVAVRIYQNDTLQLHETYPFSEISGLGTRHLKLRDGRESMIYYFFTLRNRKGDSIVHEVV